MSLRSAGLVSWAPHRGTRGFASGLWRRLHVLTLAAIVLSSAGACGKKGPPLAPLRLVPARVADVSARRVASEVELQFVLPSANQGAPGPVDLDRIEVYAITVAPGTVPPNRDLLVKDRLVGTISVKPPLAEGEEPASGAASTPDNRPSPGDRVSFVEALTPDTLKPFTGRPGTTSNPSSGAASQPQTAAAGPPAGASPGGQSAGPPSVLDKPVAGPPASGLPGLGSVGAVPLRLYVIRGVSRRGRAGPPSERVAVPLVLGPAPPSHVAVTSTARGVVVDWIPPLAEVGAAPIVFNVYQAAAPKVALNRPAVSGVEYLHSDAPFDEEVCLVVRSVQTVQRVPVESEPSAPVCVTPRDTYPPAAPRGLRAAAVAEGISLSWDANTEPDLAGYIVLRGETPDGTLQPLTPEPIRVTTYRDTTVEPGVRYVYALVAVDTASPPNISAQSAPQDVIAR